MVPTILLYRMELLHLGQLFFPSRIVLGSHFGAFFTRGLGGRGANTPS